MCVCVSGQGLSNGHPRSVNSDSYITEGADPHCGDVENKLTPCSRKVGVWWQLHVSCTCVCVCLQDTFHTQRYVTHLKSRLCFPESDSAYICSNRRPLSPCCSPSASDPQRDPRMGRPQQSRAGVASVREACFHSARRGEELLRHPDAAESISRLRAGRLGGTESLLVPVQRLSHLEQRREGRPLLTGRTPGCPAAQRHRSPADMLQASHDIYCKSMDIYLPRNM